MVVLIGTALARVPLQSSLIAAVLVTRIAAVPTTTRAEALAVAIAPALLVEVTMTVLVRTAPAVPATVRERIVLLMPLKILFVT